MTDPSSVPALPPFYSQPTPLAAERHKTWRLLAGDAAFAAETVSAPATLSEFMAASRFYPILFTGPDPTPVILLGLQRTNLFVEDGRWAQDAYIPAYVRRYPFVLIEAPDKQSFALGLDAASDRVAKQGGEGAALFEDDQPTEVTRQALEFCRLFNLDHQRTRAFCQALGEADILVERRADIALPDGRKLNLGGFKVVDFARFMALPDETVLAWHKRSWLALVHHHLASLDRFQALLQRQNRLGAAEPSPEPAKAVERQTVLQ